MQHATNAATAGQSKTLQAGGADPESWILGPWSLSVATGVSS
jgi:hypothetical protein